MPQITQSTYLVNDVTRWDQLMVLIGSTNTAGVPRGTRTDYHSWFSKCIHTCVFNMFNEKVFQSLGYYLLYIPVIVPDFLIDQKISFSI